MYNINGWIELLDVDSHVPGEDWRLARDRDTEKLDSWKKRVASYECGGIIIGIRQLNGDSVLIVHAVRPVNHSQMNEIKSLISEIAVAYCESRGLVYVKDDSKNGSCSYFVVVAKGGEVSVRHDPFLTDVKL